MRARSVLVTAVVVLGAASVVAAPDPQWTVTTDSSTYDLGEPVGFTVEVCNLGDEVAVVDINVGVGVVDASGVAVWSMFIVPWVNLVSLAPGECVTAVEIRWDQRDFDGQQVPPGFYRGEAMDRQSAPFEILDQPPPAVPLATVVPAALVIAILVSGSLLLWGGRAR